MKRKMNEKQQSNPMDDASEQKHFSEVIYSFSEYQLYMFHELGRRKKALEMLSEEHQKLLPNGITGMTNRIHELYEKSKINQEVLLKAVKNALPGLQLRKVGPATPPSCGLPVPVSAERHLSKLRSTMHQFSREWSAEGKAERDACFNPILEQLELHLPLEKEEYNTCRVLVPGAGLGRLCIEICGRGYACQGNEFSYFMLLAGDLALNKLHEPTTIYPWIDNPSNEKRVGDIMRPVEIPDIPAHEILKNNPNGDLSMCAGEFLEVYRPQKGQWNSVVTCFFIDTAPNIVDYIQGIFEMLKPGGFWINHGPLLFHWQSTYDNKTDSRYQQSIEVSFEDVKTIAKNVGFAFMDNEKWTKTTYSGNNRSMMSTLYDIVLFTCQKPLKTE